jgi:hypothetical protein
MIDLGLGSLTLKMPLKPVKMEGPTALDTSALGGNVAANTSFLNVVNSLAQAFKFLPKYDQMNYQYSYSTLDGDPATKALYESALSEFDWSDNSVFGDYSKQYDPSGTSDPGGIRRSWGEHVGESYKNLNFQAGASDWNLVDTVDADDSSILDDINAYFSGEWDDIKTTGAGKSYYEIAKNGIGNLTAKESFDLMASMLESRERVFSALRGMFGETADLSSNQAVQDNFTKWLSQYTDLDPHNIAILSMFFGMQTDFVNTIDAYMNCNTYWGGDLTTQGATTDLGTFGSDLISKVNSYISGLSDTSQQSAAQRLLSKWTDSTERWDKVGDKWTGEMSTATEDNWVKYFQTEIRKYIDQDVMRVIVGNIMNRSMDREYKAKKADYDSKKDDLQLDEIAQQRMMAKNKAEAKRNTVKAKKTSPIAKAKAPKKPTMAARPVAPKPEKVVTPQATTSLAAFKQTLAVVQKSLVKSAPAAAPAAAKPASSQGQKKDNKKVI